MTWPTPASADPSADAAWLSASFFTSVRGSGFAIVNRIVPLQISQPFSSSANYAWVFGLAAWSAPGYSGRSRAFGGGP